MRINILILATLFFLAGGAGPAAAAPKVGADGASLVLEGKETRKSENADTLYELLGQEVQVFIFNNKTRVWPQVYVKSGSSYGGPRLSNPQVEALIQKYASAYGVDPTLVRAVMRHESGFNAGAVSPKGAQGLMQLMPGTAALMGVRNPFDPEQNVAGGVGYLRRCLDRFGHNVPLAVAAYNAGPEAVAKYCNIPPYEETQNFVSNVMGAYGGPPRMKPQIPGKTKSSGDPTKGQPGSKSLKKGAKPQEESAAAPRRPRAKVIEVRSPKSKARDTGDD